MVIGRPTCAAAAAPAATATTTARTAAPLWARCTPLIGSPPQERPGVDAARPGNRREDRNQREDEEQRDAPVLECVHRRAPRANEADVRQRRANQHAEP